MNILLKFAPLLKLIAWRKLHKKRKDDVFSHSEVVRSISDFTSTPSDTQVFWESYLISCSKLWNISLSKNSGNVMSRPSQSFFMVTMPGF